jgi:hypothetical protein
VSVNDDGGGLEFFGFVGDGLGGCEAGHD